jgi:hypothetical protein
VIYIFVAIFHLGTDNVALKQDTTLRYVGGESLSSYPLVDGNTERPNCVEFTSFRTDFTVEFNVSFDQAVIIRDMKIYMSFGGMYDL